MSVHCPCGHQRPFDDCCQRFISGLLVPETAEELMRSRYSAYAKGFADYLVETHDPDTRAPGLRESVARWAASVQFTRLTIRDREDGGALHQTGIVAFEAQFVERGRIQTMRERSRFRRHGGRWVYTAGTPA